MVTLKDIAYKAGLSPGTVSDILNGRSGVKYSQETVARVHQVAQAVGYRRDRAASALRQGRSMTVGMLAPDLLNPFYATLLKRFMVRLRADGYSIIVQECEVSSDPVAEREALLDLCAHRIDGLFALTMHGAAHRELLTGMAESGISVLTTGLEAPARRLDLLEIDIQPGLEQLVTTLHGYGHRHFVFIGASPQSQDGGPLWQTLSPRLEAQRLHGEPAVILRCEQTPEDAHRVCLNYLETYSQKARATALIVINDYLSLGVLRACRDRGLVVPRDLSVAAFDNTPQAALWPCALSSVGVNLNHAADRLSNLLVNRMRGLNAKGKRVRFQADFHQRESTGPAPTCSYTQPIAISSDRQASQLV